jgi:hypothetical protein
MGGNLTIKGVYKMKCNNCDEKFSNKKDLIKHLKDEIEMLNRICVEAEYDIDIAKQQLEEINN